MMLKNKNHYGFTIVELLIVIVVIAILAAISVVAYSGIQIRANNTQTTAAVKDYIKAYNLYALDKGNYPNTGSTCLGEGYPGPNNYCLSQSGTAECFSTGAVVASTAVSLNALLKPYMNNQVPKLSMQKISCGNTTYVGAFVYWSSTSDTPTFSMLLSGNQDCPAMSPNVKSVIRATAIGITRCTYVLETIT